MMLPHFDELKRSTSIQVPVLVIMVLNAIGMSAMQPTLTPQSRCWQFQSIGCSSSIVIINRVISIKHSSVGTAPHSTFSSYTHTHAHVQIPELSTSTRVLRTFVHSTPYTATTASSALTSATRNGIVICGCFGCCVYDSSSSYDCSSNSAIVGKDSAIVDVAH